MTPEISEFSYGFALTNEIIGWVPLSAAPVFPSLIEEGRKGGGYDVKLDMPAVPLFLQFKRSDCMRRRSAREISKYGLEISRPFYRFKITESGKSCQHDLLLELDDGTNHVFYAAPRFHELEEINMAWTKGEVASRSIFVRPSDVGALDDESHHVAFDHERAFLCSEPRPVNFMTNTELERKLSDMLKRAEHPLRKQISDIVDGMADAQRRAIERALERERARFTRAESRDFEELQAPVPSYPIADAIPVAKPAPPPSLGQVPTRRAKTLTGPKAELREIADIAAKKFNAQFIVIQSRL